MSALTDVDYSQHVKAGWKIASDADQCVVKYLPSSDHSQLSKRLVYCHLARCAQRYNSCCSNISAPQQAC